MHDDEWTEEVETTESEASLTVELVSQPLGQRAFWWTALAVVAGNAIYGILGDLFDLVRSELEGLLRSLS
jgi:hypothetical protein